MVVSTHSLILSYLDANKFDKEWYLKQFPWLAKLPDMPKKETFENETQYKLSIDTRIAEFLDIYGTTVDIDTRL